MSKSLERLGKTVNDDKLLAIMSGLAKESEVEQRILQGGNDELTRAHIDKVINNHYERMEGEQSEVGAIALAVTVRNTAETCQL